METTTSESEMEQSGRRNNDRRQSQKPFNGVDKRKGDRRSGKDRRASPRIDAQ